MKNKVKIMVSALIVLATFGSATAYNGELNVKATDQKSFTLSEKNVTGSAKLSIVDQNGVTVYQSNLSDGESIKKTFDVSALPEGPYTVEYADNFKVQTVSMLIDEELSFDVSNAKIEFVPSIVKRGAILNIGMLSDSDKRFQVKIYDEFNHLLLSEAVTGTNYFGKRFDLSKIRRGDYRVVVTCEGRSFIRTVRI